MYLVYIYIYIVCVKFVNSLWFKIVPIKPCMLDINGMDSISWISGFISIILFILDVLKHPICLETCKFISKVDGTF